MFLSGVTTADYELPAEWLPGRQETQGRFSADKELMDDLCGHIQADRKSIAHEAGTVANSGVDSRAEADSGLDS
ncbi:hypothetical protein DPX16_4533 [Anabarilius grahami]|uniref:Uncharacterized protein n=1 Tax=Anabarilius grahami TaxID=495550 RepID=A0A3N0XJ98_ANAGA|nr:hypothetical protein DPX16_4533 [Anabarilius grahami]